MTALLGWGPPDGTEALIQWIKPLGETRAARPSGAVLPFRMVRRIGGPSDALCDKGLYTVSTFHDDRDLCAQEAWITHRRILLLAGNYGGQAAVTLANGSIVYADDVRIMESPIEIDFADDTPYFRYVGTYHVDFRIVAAT